MVHSLRGWPFSIRFSATDRALYLVTTKPSYMGGFFKHISKQLIPSWLNLEEIVRTGKPEGRVNDRAAGEEFFAEFVNDLFPLSYPAVNTLGQYLNLKEATSQRRSTVLTSCGIPPPLPCSVRVRPWLELVRSCDTALPMPIHAT
jgi:hypothetical protein